MDNSSDPARDGGAAPTWRDAYEQFNSDAEVGLSRFILASTYREYLKEKEDAAVANFIERCANCRADPLFLSTPEGVKQLYTLARRISQRKTYWSEQASVKESSMIMAAVTYETMRPDRTVESGDTPLPTWHDERTEFPDEQRERVAQELHRRCTGLDSWDKLSDLGRAAWRAAAKHYPDLLTEPSIDPSTDEPAAPDSPQPQQDSANNESAEERAKRRQDVIYPLWAKAQPPITSSEGWAKRAEVDKNTSRDYLNGKTKNLRESTKTALGNPLSLLADQIPD